MKKLHYVVSLITKLCYESYDSNYIYYYEHYEANYVIFIVQPFSVGLQT